MVKIYKFALLLYLITLFTYLRPTILRAQSVETIDRLRNKAEKLYAEGNYSQALSNYLDSYHLARKLDNVRAANLTVDISSIYHMQGDYRRGASLCLEGVALLKQATTQPDSVWFKLNSSLGEMYKKLNKQDSCYLYFSRANNLLRRHPELESRIADYVIYHYNNQGMMYVREGGYTEGLSYLTKAISVAEKHTTSNEDIAILQNNLGELYEGLGQFEKALALRKSAARLYAKNDFYKYQIYSGVTWDALQSKSYKEAITYSKQALSLSRSLAKTNPTQANLLAETLILNHLGQYYYQLGEYDQASNHYNRSILLHQKYLIKKGKIIADSYVGLASVQQAKGNIESALQLSQQAILANQLQINSGHMTDKLTASDAISEKGLFEAITLKAGLLWRRFQQKKNRADAQLALNTYEQALATADALRKSYNALDTKWFFATQVQPTYIKAFETAWSLYTYTHLPADKEHAFSLLERSKAATLADVNRELLIKPANVPADLLTKERTLQRTITKQKLESTGTPSPALVDAQIQLAQLQQRFEKEFPNYYRAKYQPQNVSSARVQAALEDHTAYLSCLLVQDALYTAVVTQDGLAIVRKSGNLATLRAALKTLDAALYTNPGLGNYTGTSSAIAGYRWLIEPIAHLLKNTDRLIISQDGDLHRLPFEVLETGRIVDDFLIKQYAISYVPSANALIQRVSKTEHESRNKLLGLAPFIEPVGAKTALLGLPYLPASQNEVEQLPGEPLLGKAATKARFMRSYVNYNILHFATHAYANNVEPARSFVAFYPDGSPDKLYAAEIYNLSLPVTSLVMLSACETGTGKLQPGEGVLSLAQAFAYAGCPSVVSTLWSANDESMAYLSQQLYTHLQAGLPIDVALQRTRIDYFKSALYPKLNHPHYWANLVLIGARKPVYDTPWFTMKTLGVIVGLLLCLGVALVIWQRRVARQIPFGMLWHQIGNE